MSFMSFMGYSQLTEDFEGTSTPDATSGNWDLTSGTWKVFDNGVGPIAQWGPISAAGFTYQGIGRSADVQKEGLSAIGDVSEEWLVAPQKRMRTNEQLRFYTRQGLNGDNGTLYQIRISTNADPTVRTAYQTIKTYTEFELNDGVPYNEWNEKTLLLGRAGQLVYVAFVKVYTQTETQLGDRWLLDNVRMVEQCVAPTIQDQVNPTAISARLLWTPPAQTSGIYQVAFGPIGFNIDPTHLIDVPIGQSYLDIDATQPDYYPLTPGARYEYYVRTVCPGGVYSDWSNPNIFFMLERGATCATPLIVTSPLPYSSLSNTSVYGNHIDRTTPGTSCSASGNYLESLDAVYSYTADFDGQVAISMNPFGNTNTGVFVYAGCNTIGTTCLTGQGDTTGNIRNLTLNVVHDTTYIIVVSSTSNTFNFPYLLTIQKITCAAPTAATVPVVVTGTTAATLSWNMPATSTATQWEVAVQPAGSNIPGATPIASETRYPANTRTNFVVNTGLIAGTAYQYWVRADCGNGTYSTWTGPFSFNTSICDNKCDYTFTLGDSTGANGWQGGRMEVRQGGLVVALLGPGFTTASTPVTVGLCPGLPFELFWSVAGTTPTQMRVSVKNNFGQTLYNMSTASAALFGTTLFSQMVDCSTRVCLPPTTPWSVGTRTTTGATVAYTSSGLPSVSWELYVTPVGTGIVPTPATPAMYTSTTTSYVVNDPANILPDTNYQFYVRTICSENSPSPWVLVGTAATLPTCVKPTALTITTAATTSESVTFTFAATGTTATEWQVIAIPATEPAPTASTTGWTTVPAIGPFTLHGLIRETPYNLYIRANCGVAGGLSTWFGPRAFTTLPTCYKPTALTATAITVDSAQLGWTSGISTSENWQILVLPAGSTAPTGDTPGWVTSSTNSFNLQGLQASTCYDYYVRANCGTANGVSAWSAVKSFCTLVCNNEDRCAYTFTVQDEDGDGWNGAIMQVRQNDIVVATLTGPTNAQNTTPIPVTVLLCKNTPFDLYWITGGNFADEVIITSITNRFGQILFSMPANSPDRAGTVLYAGVTDCDNPLCLSPALPTLGAEPGTYDARLYWGLPVGVQALSYEVYNVLANSAPPAPDQILGVLPATGPEITLPATLQPSTNYQYYVRVICSVNSPSQWVGPFTYRTLPTCPQPTNAIAPPTSTGIATLTWTQPGPSTNWQVVYQPEAGSTGVPTGTIRPVSGTPTFSTPAGLTPGFYEFYVRSVCSSEDPIDMSAWTGPIRFFISLPLPVCADIGINFGTNAASPVIDLCPGGSCIDLQAKFTDSKATTTYSVLPVAFAPPYPFVGGTSMNVSQDDVWAPAFTLPFKFCFFGNNYSQIQVGSNGVISFNIVTAPGTCAYDLRGLTIPNTAFPIRNAIYGVYQDIDLRDPNGVSPNRSINYRVLGEAPCRAFVVNYYEVPQYEGFTECDASVGLQTSQIVLYETSNIIEVYVQDRTACTEWPSTNGGQGVIGLQNNAGTQAHVPPNRNTGPWNAHNEGWRFTPDGASNVQFSWLQGTNVISTDPNLHICTSENTTITAQAIYSSCGVQTGIKTQSVDLRITEFNIPEIADVAVCADSYQLPVLTQGNYYSSAGGPENGALPLASTLITESQTVYVYAESATTPPCSDEVHFNVTVGGLVAPIVTDVEACGSYILPALAAPFNYYTEANGLGTMYPGDALTEITTSQLPLYIHGATGDCFGESSFNVRINPKLDPGFTFPVYCEGSAIPTFETTSPTAGFTGTWSPATVTTTGVYTFTLDPGQCATQPSYDYTITVDGFHPPIPGDVLTCGSFTLPAIAAPFNYYTLPNGQGTMYAGDALTEITESHQPLYIFATNGTCSGESSFNIAVTPIKDPDFTFQVYCTGGALPTLELTAPNGVTGTWSPAVVTTTGIYTFTVDAGQCTSQPSFDYTITVDGFNPPTPVDVEVCGSYVLPVIPAPFNYYTLPNGQGTTYAGNALTEITASQLPIYIFAGNANCSGESSFNIKVNPILDPNFIFQPYCVGTPFPVLGTTAPNGVTGTWSPSTITTTGIYTFTVDAGQCPTQPSFDYTISVYDFTPPAISGNVIACGSYVLPVLPAPFNYYTLPNGQGTTYAGTALTQLTASQLPIYIFAGNASCSGEVSYNITIQPIVAPGFTFTDYCADETLPTLNETSPTGVVGTWSPAAITTTGVYRFTPAGSCSTQPFYDYTINVFPVETPVFTLPTFLCTGATAAALPNTSDNTIVGTWVPNAISNTQSGAYVFTPTPVAGHCYDPFTLNVTVSDNPQFRLFGECNANNVYEIKATLPSGLNATAVTFAWTDPTGGSAGNTQSIFPTMSGNYTLKVTITASGCSSQESWNVDSTGCQIQKGISPRGVGPGDGKNDSFDLSGMNVSELEIFNRYGTKVYSLKNYTNQWYGQSKKGDELPDGTYYYVIKRDTAATETGWIYINREK